MTTLEQHFCVLGLQRGCTSSELRKAYRQKALQFHPDRNPAGGEVFKRILHSYEELQRFFQQNGGKNNLCLRGTSTRSGNHFSSASSYFTDSEMPTNSTDSTAYGTTSSHSTGPTWSRFHQAAAAAGEYQKQKRNRHFSSSKQESYEDPTMRQAQDSNDDNATDHQSSSPLGNKLPSFEKRWWENRSRRSPCPSAKNVKGRPEILRRGQPTRKTSDFIAHEFRIPPFTSIPKTLAEMDFLFEQLYSRHLFVRERLSKWEEEEKELFGKIKLVRLRLLWVELQGHEEEEEKRKILRTEWSGLEQDLQRWCREEDEGSVFHSRDKVSIEGQGRKKKKREESGGEKLEENIDDKKKDAQCNTRKQRLLEELKIAEQRYHDAQEIAALRRRRCPARRVKTVSVALCHSSEEETREEQNNREKRQQQLGEEEDEKAQVQQQKEEKVELLDKQVVRRTVLIRRLLSGVYLAEEKELQKLSDTEIFAVLGLLQEREKPSNPSSCSPDKEEKTRKKKKGEEKEILYSSNISSSQNTDSSIGRETEDDHDNNKTIRDSHHQNEGAGEDIKRKEARHGPSSQGSGQPFSFITPKNILLLGKVFLQRLTSNYPCSFCHVEPKSAAHPSPFICNHSSVCRKCRRIAVACPICGAQLITPSSEDPVPPIPVPPSSSGPSLSRVQTKVGGRGGGLGSGAEESGSFGGPASTAIPMSDHSPLFSKSPPFPSSFTRSKCLASMVIPLSGEVVAPPPPLSPPPTVRKAQEMSSNDSSLHNYNYSSPSSSASSSMMMKMGSPSGTSATYFLFSRDKANGEVSPSDPSLSASFSLSGIGGKVVKEMRSEVQVGESMTASCTNAMWFKKYRSTEDGAKKKIHRLAPQSSPTSLAQNSSSLFSAPRPGMGGTPSFDDLVQGESRSVTIRRRKGEAEAEEDDVVGMGVEGGSPSVEETHLPSEVPSVAVSYSSGHPILSSTTAVLGASHTPLASVTRGERKPTLSPLHTSSFTTEYFSPLPRMVPGEGVPSDTNTRLPSSSLHAPPSSSSRLSSSGVKSIQSSSRQKKKKTHHLCQTSALETMSSSTDTTSLPTTVDGHAAGGELPLASPSSPPRLGFSPFPSQQRVSTSSSADPTAPGEVTYPRVFTELHPSASFSLPHTPFRSFSCSTPASQRQQKKDETVDGKEETNAHNREEVSNHFQAVLPQPSLPSSFSSRKVTQSKSFEGESGCEGGIDKVVFGSPLSSHHNSGGNESLLPGISASPSSSGSFFPLVVCSNSSSIHSGHNSSKSSTPTPLPPSPTGSTRMNTSSAERTSSGRVMTPLTGASSAVSGGSDGLASSSLSSAKRKSMKDTKETTSPMEKNIKRKNCATKSSSSSSLHDFPSLFSSPCNTPSSRSASCRKKETNVEPPPHRVNDGAEYSMNPHLCNSSINSRQHHHSGASSSKQGNEAAVRSASLSPGGPGQQAVTAVQQVRAVHLRLSEPPSLIQPPTSVANLHSMDTPGMISTKRRGENRNARIHVGDEKVETEQEGREKEVGNADPSFIFCKESNSGDGYETHALDLEEGEVKLALLEKRNGEEEEVGSIFPLSSPLASLPDNNTLEENTEQQKKRLESTANIKDMVENDNGNTNTFNMCSYQSSRRMSETIDSEERVHIVPLRRLVIPLTSEERQLPRNIFSSKGDKKAHRHRLLSSSLSPA